MDTATSGDASRRSRRWPRLAALALGLVAALAASAMADRARNYLLAVASGARAPRLEIGVKFKDLHPIFGQRDLALRTGRLLVSDEDFAPASLEVDGQLARAELRLAEGPAEDLAGRKWPLQMRVAKGNQVFGLRAFTLTPPSPGGPLEALFLDHLEQLDVLAARLLFVDTALNGKGLGLMALTELPSTELLERQQRRDGVVVRIVAAPRTEVVALEPARVERSRKLAANLDQTREMIEAWLDRTRRADEVFDPGAMGRFLAVAEHWDAGSSLDRDNLRFYLNPLTARLEPVGIPLGRPAAKSDRGAPPSETPFAKRMLANPAIAAAFGRARREIAVAFASDSAWQQAAERERALRRLLQREDPSLPAIRFAALRDAPRPPIPAPAPRELRRASERLERGPLPLRSVEENLERHAFLRWDAEAGTLRVQPGAWSVQGSLILPPGIGLTVPAGTVLRFEPRAGLIARGPLRFEGHPDAQIVLEGPPGTKRSKLWSGVYLIESEAASRWSHVVVRNTGGFKREGWALSGGVVFRRTHVELDHCSLRTSRADDALNLVRATFRLDQLEVRDARYDAIDFDHSQGSVEGGVIAGAGGDGLDLGGSQVEVSGTRISEIHDKAISVGEHSHLVARGIHAERAAIGIASKNASSAELFDSQLRQISGVGLIAYTKRAEYGPGLIHAEGNRFDQIARLSLAEEGSRIVVDGVEVSAEAVAFGSVDAVTAPE